MRGSFSKTTVIILAFLLLASLGGMLFLLWKSPEVVKKEVVYLHVPPNRSFIHDNPARDEYGFEDYIKSRTEEERERLIKEKRDFIDINLKEMELALYEGGKKGDSFDVLSKGREGSYWETPPGVYFAGDKVAKHFSSMAEVWMPYGIQFYGNFFIHGWPYDEAGRALPSGPSGGCLRMRTADAKQVFEFAKRGMPVLVFEEKRSTPMPALSPLEEEIPPPAEIEAQNLMAADLETGQVLLRKNASSPLLAGPVTRVMLALSFSEIVNLERSILSRQWMIEGMGEDFIVPGINYQGKDLLHHLLVNSSREAAAVMTRFFSPEYFTNAMNAKASSIGMESTEFLDPVDFSEEGNVTSLMDTAKMMRYIYQYRGFILERSNIFRDSGKEGRESLFAVLEVQRKGEENKRTLFVALSRSEDIKDDYDKIIQWLQEEMGIDPIDY